MANAIGKLNCQRVSNGGSNANKTRDGSTSQKTPMENRARRDASCVSRHSQIMARMETRGNDAISAPKNELRFATSEMAKISKAEMRILRIAWTTANETKISHGRGGGKFVVRLPACSGQWSVVSGQISRHVVRWRSLGVTGVFP